MHTFNEVFDILLKMQAAQSPNTFNQAKCVIAHLRPFFGPRTLDDFAQDYEVIWSEYRAHCSAQVTRAGKRRKLAHDRRYLVQSLKRAENKGWITKVFTKKNFQLKEAHEPVGRALSDDESSALLRALDCHPRTQLQVLMALTMGMRIGEILNLRKDEVDLVAGTIKLDPNRLKTRQARKVPIPIANSVVERLNAQVASVDSPFVFPMESDPGKPQTDNRHWWDLARSKAGVQCRFHDLRHTWASNMVSMGMSQEWIVQVGGFTQAVMSRVYAHMNTKDQDKFRAAFDGKFEQRPVGTLTTFKKRVFTTLRF